MTASSEGLFKVMSSIEQEQMQAEQRYVQDANAFWHSLSKDQQLYAFFKVIRTIADSELKEDFDGYRKILYERFEFDHDSYFIGMLAGFMDLHNSITRPSKPAIAEDEKKSATKKVDIETLNVGDTFYAVIKNVNYTSDPSKITKKIDGVEWYRYEKPKASYDVQKNRVLGVVRPQIEGVWGNHERSYLETKLYVEITAGSAVERGFLCESEIDETKMFVDKSQALAYVAHMIQKET